MLWGASPYTTQVLALVGLPLFCLFLLKGPLLPCALQGRPMSWPALSRAAQSYGGLSTPQAIGGFLDGGPGRRLTGGWAACWGRVEGPVLITTPLSLSALRDTRLRGKGSRAPALGECWGPGGGVPRPQKQRPGLEGGVLRPLGVVSRTEVREGSGHPGLLPTRPQGGRAPGGGLRNVALGCSSLEAQVGRSGGTEQGEESPETPRPPHSPTCDPQHLLLEEMDEMGNWPPE